MITKERIEKLKRVEETLEELVRELEIQTFEYTTIRNILLSIQGLIRKNERYGRG